MPDDAGDRLRGYVDGKLLMEAVDGSLATGSPGLAMFKTATHFDDFAAAPP